MTTLDALNVCHSMRNQLEMIYNPDINPRMMTPEQ